MSLRYIQRVESDEAYYIDNKFVAKDLMNLYNEIEEAEKQLKDYKSRILSQYNKVTRCVKYYRVEAIREQKQYSSDKKVYIVVRLYEYFMLDGEEVYYTSIYGKSKQFRYQQMEEALKYANELRNEYTAKYINSTGYKKMNCGNYVH